MNNWHDVVHPRPFFMFQLSYIQQTSGHLAAQHLKFHSPSHAYTSVLHHQEGLSLAGIVIV